MTVTILDEGQSSSAESVKQALPVAAPLTKHQRYNRTAKGRARHRRYNAKRTDLRNERAVRVGRLYVGLAPTPEQAQILNDQARREIT
jgi:hypothetical protein